MLGAIRTDFGMVAIEWEEFQIFCNYSIMCTYYQLLVIVPETDDHRILMCIVVIIQ
jgi:hypothetical protein